MKSSPFTRNPEATELIKNALANCAGCRQNWRTKTGPQGNIVHPVPGGTVQCWAVADRQRLKDIARKAKT